MNVSAGRGAFVFQLHCQKAIMTQRWGLGAAAPGPRHSIFLWRSTHTQSQAWTDNTLRNTPAQPDKPTEAHILLAVVVHSVPASSFTVFFSITVNTLAVESLPLVSLDEQL